MNEQTYEMLHASADRLALEAARRAPAGKEADDYTEAYAKVLELLASEYKKYSPTQDKTPSSWTR